MLDKNDIKSIVNMNVFELYRQNPDNLQEVIQKYKEDMKVYLNEEELSHCHQTALEMLMKSRDLKKELKLIAKDLVFIKDSLENERIAEWEREELRESYTDVLKRLYELGYEEDNEVIKRYMKEYREVNLGKYQQWLND